MRRNHLKVTLSVFLSIILIGELSAPLFVLSQTPPASDEEESMKTALYWWTHGAYLKRDTDINKDKKNDYGPDADFSWNVPGGGRVEYWLMIEATDEQVQAAVTAFENAKEDVREEFPDLKDEEEIIKRALAKEGVENLIRTALSKSYWAIVYKDGGASITFSASAGSTGDITTRIGT